MRNGVRDWVQEGRLYVWRYANPNRSWRGWHFTGDPTGCASIRNLLDRMYGGEPCRRTLRIEPVTDAILSVPNYGQPIAGHFDKLRIEYQPGFADLALSPEDGVLTMHVGDGRLRKLSAAFVEMEVGLGDFGIGTSDAKRADPWMFWWMPDVKYQRNRR